MTSIYLLMAEHNRRIIMHGTAPIDLTADHSTGLLTSPPTGLSSSSSSSPPTAIATATSNIAVIGLTADYTDMAVSNIQPTTQACTPLARFRCNFNKKELSWLHDGLINADMSARHEIVNNRKHIRRSLGGPFDSPQDSPLCPLFAWTWEQEMAAREAAGLQDHAQVVEAEADCQSIDIFLGPAMQEELNEPVSESENESEDGLEEMSEVELEDVPGNIYNPTDYDIAQQMERELTGPEPDCNYHPTDHDIAQMLEQGLAGSDFESEEEWESEGE